MELNTKELQYFETDFFDGAFGNQRYGQAACNHFNLPKDIEDLIWESRDITYCRNIIWQFMIEENQNENS